MSSWTMHLSAIALIFVLFVSRIKVLQCAGRLELEFDLRTGQVSPSIPSRDEPYIKILDGPTHSRSTSGPCDGQVVLMLDFSGPFKKAKFELFYGTEPRLWTMLISDSPYSYGFGANHRYSSNCASAQIYNRQLRLYSNMLPDFRYQTMDGHNLMNVIDDVVESGANLTLEVGDEMVNWRVHGRNTSLPPNKQRSKYLFTLSGQRTAYGPVENRIYASFNRVPYGSFHNGSGVCKVRITFKRDQGSNHCAKGIHNCHEHAICRPVRHTKTFKCVCKPGYHGSGHQCSDVNECNLRNGDCQHSCHNLPGNYSCSCRPGFELHPDQRTCIANDTSNLLSKKIRIRLQVGQCNINRRTREMFIRELKRKLLNEDVCTFPCKIHGLSLRCRARKNGNMLQANFELELDQSLLLPARFCNKSCLRCQMEERLQTFIVGLRSLADNEKFNVSLRGQVYTLNRKSLKVATIKDACMEGRKRPRKTKRVVRCTPGTYFDIFLLRCVNCPRGSYQPNNSETFCFPCPDNMTTTHPCSTDISKCKATTCGGNLTHVRGVITSPSYPDTYPQNIECTWTIHPPRNRGILLLMLNISLPLTPDCSHYLTMRGNESPYSVSTFYACESYDQPVAVISRSKSLFIKFSAQGHGSAEGFKIFYVTFEENFKGLVETFVESGELFANESLREVLQNETLVTKILDLMVDPIAKFEDIDQEAREKLPNLYDFVDRKLREYYVTKPYGIRR